MSKRRDLTPSNEAIAAALISCGTVQAAAEQLGISTRTIYDRRRDADFRASYQDARNELLRAAVSAIGQRLLEAITVTAEIMNDQSVNPATRLQCAQTILANAGKLSEQLTKDELTSRTIRDPFDFMGIDA